MNHSEILYIESDKIIMRREFNHEYEIGEYVYHNTPESSKGIVTNVLFNMRENCTKYEVAFGRLREDNVLCYEEELTRDKVF